MSFFAMGYYTDKREKPVYIKALMGLTGGGFQEILHKYESTKSNKQLIFYPVGCFFSYSQLLIEVHLFCMLSF